MPSGPHLQPASRRVLGSSSTLDAPARMPPMVAPAPGRPADTGLRDDAGEELARLQAELEELRERARLAEAAQKRSAARLRAAFLDFTERARAELRAIEAAHEAAVAALEVDDSASAGGRTSTVAVGQVASDPLRGGP